MNTVCHMSSVHPVDDIRILHKESVCLASAGYDVHLVAIGTGAPYVERGVNVHPVAASGARLKRASVGAAKVLHTALGTGAELFHFHDPELIPFGLLLRGMGKRVIYDVHESLPKAVMSKPYLHPAVRRSIATAAGGAERAMGRFASAIVTATPAIARDFPAEKTLAVQNFPILDELVAPPASPYQSRSPVAVYTGGVSAIRGAREMVLAMGQTTSEARLSLVGTVKGADLQADLPRLDGWERVDAHGQQPRERLPDLLGAGRVGLVLFHPEPNHVEAMPNKMFEYMSAGLPIIASDFPLWRGILEEVGAGLVVDPMDPAAIARAIDWMMEHPEEAEAMGQRGRAAVDTRFNWEAESQKLIALYGRLLS